MRKKKPLSKHSSSNDMLHSSGIFPTSAEGKNIGVSCCPCIQATNRKNKKLFCRTLLNKAAGIFFVSFLMLIFLAPKAYAWGPGVHMVTGNWLLQNLIALPIPIAAVLMRYPGQYLHGCLSPDIFIGKGSRPQKGHSHNWSAGFDLLEKARSKRQEAFAYGYLSHLAADTVAHNIFVPKGFMDIPVSGKAAHVYLEIQADRLVSWDSIDARGVFHEAGSVGNLRMLRQAMRQKPFIFWLKQRLFESSIALGGAKAWRNSFSFLDKILPASNMETLDYLLALSTRAMVNMLQYGKESPVVLLDPIGAHEIELAENKQQGLAANLRQRLLHHEETESGLFLPRILSSLPHSLANLSPVCAREQLLQQEYLLRNEDRSRP